MRKIQRHSRSVLLVMVAVSIFLLVQGPGPAQAGEADNNGSGTITVEVVKNTAGYDTGLMPDNGIPAVNGGVTTESDQPQEDNRSTVSKLWGATFGLLTAPVSLAKGLIGDATGQLSNAMVSWAGGFVQGWLLGLVLNGLNWTLNNLCMLMTNNPNLFRGASGPQTVELDYTYITRYFEVIRAISFWIIMIFVLIAGVKIISGSMSGSGSWHAKKIIPRIGFAVIGGYAGLSVSQWLINLNTAVVMDVMDAMNLYETPGIKGYYDVVNKFGGMASTLVLLMGIIMIVMTLILVVMYIIRFNAIIILAIMSPFAFACSVLDETQFITFTWLKVFLGLLWVNFFHALCIVAFKAVVFSRMDAMLCSLNALALLYLMLKLPGLFLRSSSSIEGAHKTIVTKTKQIASHAAAAAA